MLQVHQSVIELVLGDITEQETDAVVNAANKQLAPGGGVAGAIHQAAGPQLWEYTRTLGGCETGEAVITYGFNIKAKYIIHTVGPVWTGSPQDPVLLRSCYIESLKLASSHDVKTVSFPAISTGIFGYPIDEAAKISLQAVMEYLTEHAEIERVRFVLFAQPDLDAYSKALNEMSRQ
jgi:O-acetyl-ADP-ribose deacetylase